MAYTTHTDNVQATGNGFFAAIEAWFARAGRAVFVARGMEARMTKIRELEALTDKELAAKGLRRDDIPGYVFRDILYV